MRSIHLAVLLAILTLGHPAEHPEARPRRALADVLRHETWTCTGN